jgi:hypothetical protein
LILLKTFLALNLLVPFPPFINHEVVSPSPKLISIVTIYPMDGVWVQIPKGTEKITFNVKAENTETVSFWLIPTGTETWKERRLIGYDIKENLNDNNFSITWNFDRPYLHDHLHIQALGEEKIAKGFINLSM